MVEPRVSVAAVRLPGYFTALLVRTVIAVNASKNFSAMVQPAAAERAGQRSAGPCFPIEPLARIASFIHRMGVVAGIQLAHAGRKESCRAPWESRGRLKPDDYSRNPFTATANRQRVGSRYSEYANGRITRCCRGDKAASQLDWLRESARTTLESRARVPEVDRKGVDS